MNWLAKPFILSLHFFRMFISHCKFWLSWKEPIENEKAIHTQLEASVLYFQQNDPCDESTATYKLYAAFDNQSFCAANPTTEQRIDTYITLLKEANVIGSGVLYVNSEPNWSGFDLLMTGSPGNPPVVWCSILIWFLVPSRKFFLSRGWIKES